MAILDYEGLLLASGEYERLARYREQAGYMDEETKLVIDVCAALCGLAIGIGPAGLAAIAAATAKLIAAHKVGLTITLLKSGVMGLIEGKAPKEIAIDMTKNLGMALGADALQDGITQWLDAVKPHLA